MFLTIKFPPLNKNSRPINEINKLKITNGG